MLGSNLMRILEVDKAGFVASIMLNLYQLYLNFHLISILYCNKLERDHTLSQMECNYHI